MGRGQSYHTEIRFIFSDFGVYVLYFFIFAGHEIIIILGKADVVRHGENTFLMAFYLMLTIKYSLR